MRIPEISLSKPNARSWPVPLQQDGSSSAADVDVAKITHLGIGAHQDDLEFMAFHGIATCYGDPDRGFGGVTCTDGGGSSRTGSFANYSDEEMKLVRAEEQEKAAEIGRYRAMWQLGYASSEIKDTGDDRLESDLTALLEATRPSVVYTHNLADKHDTHLAVAIAVLNVLRALPEEKRPAHVYGCEGWRDLDWMPDDEKVVLDVSGHGDLALRLNAVFESQIEGGKRYDHAVMGRRRANATFFDSHSVDAATEVTFAMNLTPVVSDTSIDPVEYTLGIVERFRADVADRLGKLTV